MRDSRPESPISDPAAVCAVETVSRVQRRGWLLATAVEAQPEITQRDLRTRSKEIMDAVQGGQAFTVTRDGHRVGELIPLRRRRRFVPRAEFAAMSRTAPDISLDAFRDDQDAVVEQELDDPYAR
jgi:antitoxin (DNA-binding transcriptional repressor) of toxin-antitoxin stability system